MKKSLIAIPVVLGIASTAAHAQSSVTLYGIIDAGVNYVSNLKSGNGGHAFSLVDGPPQASRWGIKGAEDLGGGMKAIFTLENGFSIANGTLSQGGRMFGRQAYVGVTGDNWGTLTAGRQYDSVVDYLAGPTANGTYGGGYFSHMFDSDNTDNNLRVDNSLKFKSLTYAGFSMSALYGFSNQAGAVNKNQALSVGAGYTNGPISIGAAYEQFDNPGANTDGAVSSTADATFVAGRQRIFGVGGTYTIGPVKAGLEWTRTVLNGITSGPIVANYLRLDNYEINARYDITPAVFVGGGYTFTDGKQSTGANTIDPKWHQVNLMLDYSLSKRTDVFLIGVFQKAAGDATFAYIYGNGSTSIQSPGSAKQVVARVGIRHKF
ncbi:porin [Paraburkholderia sediminicola]|uniref:porin n=1 Tax=Paraburkholderia sediminicola TaxID=458836 RepID=UPI0038BC8185